MKPLLTIDTPHGDFYYSMFYFLAFIAGFVMLVMEGRKRKFPEIPWLVVITTSFLFFIVGTQAIRLSMEDWQHVSQFKALEYFPGRSVLGGILFAIPGLLLTKYILGFREDVMDAFVFAAPMGLLIQRLGCLMAGCCYGTTTSVPWGIQYGTSSPVFNHHVHDHLISATDVLSIPTHPIALYEVIGCIVAMFLLKRSKKYFTTSGNLFIASVGVFLIIRFCTEFFRATSLIDHVYTGLSIVQLAILGLLPILLVIIVFRKKRNAVAIKKVRPVLIGQSLAYFLAVTLLFLVVLRWLTLGEIVTLSLVIVSTFLFIVWQGFKVVTVPKLRLATLALMVGSLVLMSQSAPQDIKSDSTKYNSIRIGFSNGNYENVYSYPGSQSCTSNSRTFNQAYTMMGIEFSTFKKKGNISSELGVNAFGGTQKESWRDVPSQTTSYQTFGANGHYRIDSKWFGAGIGLSVGNNIRMADDRNVDNQQQLEKGHYNTFILPSASLRVGPRRILFGEYRFADAFPTASPAFQHQFYLGTGFGARNGFAIKLGVQNHRGALLNLTVPIEKITIDTYVGLFNPDNSQSSSKTNQFGLSVQYHFNKKY